MDGPAGREDRQKPVRALERSQELGRGPGAVLGIEQDESDLVFADEGGLVFPKAAIEHLEVGRDD